MDYTYVASGGWGFSNLFCEANSFLESPAQQTYLILFTVVLMLALNSLTSQVYKYFHVILSSNYSMTNHLEISFTVSK